MSLRFLPLIYLFGVVLGISSPWAIADEVTRPAGSGASPPTPSLIERVDQEGALRRKYRIPSGQEYRDGLKPSQHRDDCVDDFDETTEPPKRENKYISIDFDKVVRTASLAKVPSEPLYKALHFLQQNPDRVPNSEYVAVADYTQPGKAKRFFIVNVLTGKTESFMVGQGAGREGDFKPDRPFDKFANQEGSYLTGKGCFLTSKEPYYGGFGKSFNLHGLNISNDQSCVRRVVMHKSGRRAPFEGRSRGCLSLAGPESKTIMSRIGGGAILCTHPSQ